MNPQQVYEQFKNEWVGRKVDYDHVYAYQCVDLILEFLKECAGVASGVWGNAIDYANRPAQAFLNATVKVTDGSKKPGDIIVLRGLPGNPYGHIALRDTNVDKMLEQNGATGGGTGTGRDAIGVYRNIPYDRVAAVYRIKQFVDVTPAPLASGNRTTVYLPGSVDRWRLYRPGGPYTIGSEVAFLRPSQFNEGPDGKPGIQYHIEQWVGDYAVVIQTQMFGRGVIWIKDTDAQII